MDAEMNDFLEFTSDLQDDDFFNEEEREKYLTFFVDQQLYAVPSSQVIEIISMQPITYMPSVPNYVKGVINIRGKVVPLIELQLKFKNTAHTYDEQTCIVVVEVGETHVGFIVNQVNDVADIVASQISPAPKVSKKDKDHDFITGLVKMNETTAMVLNCKKVLGILDTQAAPLVQ